MTTSPSFKIERATINDVDELLQLYFLIYQGNYPLAICSDRAVMLVALQNPAIHWFIVRDPDSKNLIASTLFETDELYGIGKLTGVVVHPDYRKRDLASLLIAHGCGGLLMPKGPLRSIYTTTRTVSKGPQVMCLKNGFIPLGIFPNAHKIQQFETLTLMAKFAEGVIKNKDPFCAVPEKMEPILKIFQDSVGLKHQIRTIKNETISRPTETGTGALTFELIQAKYHVMRRFNEQFTDRYDRFFPFHEPNMLIASTNGEVEIFAYVNKADGYLAIVALNKPIYELHKRLIPLLYQLRDIGVSYIEILIDLKYTASVATLFEAQFLPSALYPSMTEINGNVSDFVVMTRTLEPLNFRGMHIDGGFKPYIDQYLNSWKSMYLETLEVFDDYKV